MARTAVETDSIEELRKVLPVIEPPSPEEIERRRAVWERVMALREEIGPIDISLVDLIRQTRDAGYEDEE